jgi:nucleoid DNA-binding protein/cell division protein FtsN
VILGKYIKQLLEEGKRVILPGFGNLEIKDAAEGEAPSGNRINPPGPRVKFDSGYSKDDGVLAATYASFEEISQEEAGQRVLELVDAIKFALDRGEPYPLPEAGSFSRDDDGKVSFQTDPKWVLEPDQYGLESMDLLELDDEPDKASTEAPIEDKIAPPIKKEEEVSEEEKPPEEESPETVEDDKKEEDEKEEEPQSKVEEPPKKEEPVVVPPKKPVAQVTQLHEPEEQKKPTNRWRVIWIIAGALIVVLVVLIFIPIEWNKPEVESGKVESGKVEPEQSGAREGKAEQSGEVESQKPNVESLKPEEESGEVAEDSGTEHNFFIIAGSFKNLHNASILQDKLKGRGYPAEVMITENRLYRVSVSSYATKDEANRALAGVKSEPGLESCWLLSN